MGRPPGGRDPADATAVAAANVAYQLLGLLVLGASEADPPNTEKR
jgi:hypothetical protein